MQTSTGFGPENLPYGVFSRGGGERRVGVAIGSDVLDLRAAAAHSPFAELLAAPSLDPLLAAGRPTWSAVRERVRDWAVGAAPRIPLAEIDLHLPFTVGDVVDFYSNADHARNASEIFRPGRGGLPDNWLHLPVGYHTRAGSVVVSGTPVVRPCGQYPDGADGAIGVGPTRRLDLEAEVGFVVGTGSPRGGRIAVADIAEHVFGAFLVNDWSARDIQAFETVPLGPFLGKSFATSISPWVVPLDALDAARVAPPPRDPEPAAYLRDVDPWGLDLALEVRLNGHVVSRPPFRRNHWTIAQQLAHLTVNGAPTRAGDVLASGTVSGPERDQRGCLLELTWNGRDPLTLADGATRTYLEDGDEVTVAATAPGPDGTVVSFGEVTGRVLPALPL